MPSPSTGGPVTAKSPFWFTPGSALFGPALGPRTHVALAPSRPDERPTLFSALTDALALPAGPPRTWDGLSEALRDLRWLRCDSVVLLHRVLPRLPEPILAGYVDVLLRATWERAEGTPALHVVFPLASWVDVDALLP